MPTPDVFMFKTSMALLSRHSPKCCQAKAQHQSETPAGQQHVQVLALKHSNNSCDIVTLQQQESLQAYLASGLL
jgi:hypothetical protein